MQTLHRRSTAILLTIASLSLVGCLGGGSSSSAKAPGGTSPEDPRLDPARVLPLVFVHGLAGSGSQYQTQAMRFASNDYPEQLISAFEYSTASTPEVLAAASGAQSPALEAYIDQVLAEHSATEVYLVCHSLGTRVCGQYLSSTPERAAKVAAYVGVDGVTAESCPGEVPCMGVFVNPDSRLGDNNLHLPDETHVQVATSEASFAGQFEFFTGTAPATRQIVEQVGELQVSGRAVYFPANSGAAGTTLSIWEIDGETGARLDNTPLQSLPIGASGNWGPVTLQGNTHYEFQLLRPGRSEHHFYRQPLLRNTSLMRFNTSPAGSAIELNTNAGNAHASLVISRDMEWWANRGAQTDVLQVSTSTPAGDQPAVNVLRADMNNDKIGLHVHDDAATPAQTTGALLPYFPSQPFQSGVDVYMPAANPPDGVISVVSTPRGDIGRQQVVNVPNWASASHRISIIFNDYVQD